MGSVHILGGKGFIGGRLVSFLAGNCRQPVVGWGSSDHDLRDPEAVSRLLRDVADDDVVIMAAAISRLRENSYRAMLWNMAMAENLAEALSRRRVGQLMFLSTVDVYGLLTEGQKITETLAPAPNDHYAISKLASEHLLTRVARRQGIPFLVMRLTGVYGPGDGGRSTVGTMLASARRDREVRVFGDGAARRDFLFVDDVGQIAKEAMTRRLSGVFNVATGVSLTIREIAGIVAEKAGGIPVVTVAAPQTGAERARDMVYDVTRLRAAFPCILPTSLRTGIEAYAGRFPAKTGGGEK